MINKFIALLLYFDLLLIFLMEKHDFLFLLHDTGLFWEGFWCCDDSFCWKRDSLWHSLWHVSDFLVGWFIWLFITYWMLLLGWSICGVFISFVFIGCYMIPFVSFLLDNRYWLNFNIFLLIIKIIIDWFPPIINGLLAKFITVPIVYIFPRIIMIMVCFTVDIFLLGLLIYCCLGLVLYFWSN